MSNYHIGVIKINWMRIIDKLCVDEVLITPNMDFTYIWKFKHELRHRSHTDSYIPLAAWIC